MIESNKQLKQFYSQRTQELNERQPLCKHFGECGGCSWQNLNYSTQVQIKQEALQQIMQPVTTETLSVIPSPEEFNYRARMDYVCSYDPFHPPLERMGLRKRKAFNHVIDLEECHLIDPRLFVKVHKVYAEAQRLGIPLYDLVSFKGDLRYLVVRTSGEQAMLIIITKTQDNAAQIAKLAEFALQAGITGVYWQLQPSQSDVSFGDTIQYWGEQFLKFTVGGENSVTLQIGPNNFFQNNIPQFNRLLEHVAANIHDHELLADLYCGVGTIGLALAGKYAQVIGVELEPASIEMAKLNAANNNVTNTQFYAGDVGQLREVAQIPQAQSLTAIVDPPRAGLMAKGVTEVLNIRPKELIYISCNPITQAQDLQLLASAYKLESLTGFDMFPQTPHMESVAVLSRI